jgi:hypothetical protein
MLALRRTDKKLSNLPLQTSECDNSLEIPVVSKSRNMVDAMRTCMPDMPDTPGFRLPNTLSGRIDRVE